MSGLLLLLLLVSTVVGLTLAGRSHRRKTPLPPGPRGLPLLGNILDFPRSNFGMKFSEMAVRYGNVMHLKLFGQSTVVLGSYQTAIDLLEKRSGIYSDRPRSAMADLSGVTGWILVPMPYTAKWRLHRRSIVQSFNPAAIQSYHPILTATTNKLLRDLSATPHKFIEHLGFAFAKSILKVIYGIEVIDHDDIYLQTAEAFVQIGAEMLVPGAFPVDTIPMLRYLPSWLPGVQFKRQAALWKAQTCAYGDRLFEAGKASFAHGTTDSVIGRLLGSCDGLVDGETKELCIGVTTMSYVGGVETTHIVSQVFFLAMAMHPDAQRNAQDELDSVVGVDKLPTFADRESLPYINALLKEVLRWHTMAPIGIAHRSIADDVYEGYFIPAGSVIIPNIWAMSQDESAYPDPDRFLPERFLREGRIDPNVRDPTTFAFGFGRRICPGLHFADAQLFITFASILHVFRIGPPKDEHGTPQPLRKKYTTDTLTAKLEQFGCTIEPRSPHAADLVCALFGESA
ncbi:cytochrome P450 [Trametes elegans]|nr:cytochrome P450 [Trametes elegans]